MPSNASRPILCVVGARPNFMKIAPIMRAFKEKSLPAVLVHTGQHYDEAMNEQFFRELDIPAPDINLEVGSGSHAVQTADIMRRFEPVVDDTQPAAVLVVGDVNSTIACALVASKKGVQVIHVEAGLRSRDRTMPEEINRVLTDQISDLLFTTEEHALANLQSEGIDAGKVHFVGNVMIDTLFHNLGRSATVEDALKAQGVDPARIPGNGTYALLTMHRPSNVDHKDILEGLVGCLNQIADEIPIIFPVHPRTRARLESFGLLQRLNAEHIIQLPPLGYLHLLGIMQNARIVLTDSGGIQEETTALGIPCLTLRHNTERPITLTEGTNRLVGNDPAVIMEGFRSLMSVEKCAPKSPKFWDGLAAERIADIIETHILRASPAKDN